MKRFAQLLLSRSSIVEKPFTKSASEIQHREVLHNLMSHAGFSTSSFVSADASKSSRVWADFSIYKGRAALSMFPVLPKFNNAAFGVSIERRGAVMLKFTPAIPGQQQKYDWEKKQVFALSATEVGSLISLDPNESCEFFHDPSMKTSLAGQVRKSLAVVPISDGGDRAKINSDGGGYFFNLNVVSNVEKTNERFSVPVTKAEFAVMRTALSFILPHIMGWDRITYSYPKSSETKVQWLEVPASPDLEWGR